jgi:hypothetical protein
MSDMPDLNALPPYRFCALSNKVFGRDHHGGETPVCDVRGWGYLTGKGGGLGLDDLAAIEVQKRTGEAIATALNTRADLPAPDALADPRVVALVEALQWYESRRQDAIAAAESIHAREDAAVLELCRRHGYGAVIDAACRLWARTKDGAKGAFFIGGCIGDTSARDALEAAKGAGE